MFVSITVSQSLLLAIALHAALIGSAAAAGLWRALPEGADGFALRAFFSLALGLALQMALLFVTGVAGALNASVLIAAGAATGVLALVWLARGGAFETRWRVAPREIVVAAAFYVAVAAAAVRVPGYSDDTMYHLPLARFYAQTGGLGLDPWVRFPLFPQNMELLFALAFALRPGDFVLAQGLSALQAFVIVLGLIGAAQWLRGSWLLGVGAGVVFLVLHVVDDMLGYAYIDLGLALFCFAAMLGAVVFGRGAPLGVYVALGALAGTAAGCKYHGLVAAALAFAILAAFRAKRSAIVAFAGATALFGCGWYLRSYWISGDPISPAGGPWFGYFLWNAADLAGQKTEQATHGVGTHFWMLPQALIKAGAALVIPALVPPIASRRERAATLALWAAFLAYFLFWFYSSQVNRYLAPAFAIGVLLSLIFVFDLAVLAIGRFAPRALAMERRPALAAAAATALLVGYGIHAWEHVDAQLRKWNGIFENRSGYAALREANLLAPRYGSRLVGIGLEGSAYFYDGILIGDWFGPGRYRQMVVFGAPSRLIPAAKMRETLQGFGARLLGVNLRFATFDEADYRTEFDVILDDGNQALLALKSGS